MLSQQEQTEQSRVINEVRKAFTLRDRANDWRLHKALVEQHKTNFIADAKDAGFTQEQAEFMYTYMQPTVHRPNV